MNESPKPSANDSSLAVRPRLDSVDLLRGLVMVLMAVDHTRGFFTNTHFDPLDLKQTNTPLFLTRWMTHLCAPVFFSLAGVGAFLWRSRGKTTAELSRFLLTRGLFIVLMDVTVTCWFGWKFNFDAHEVYTVVLWAVGWCMVALAGLIWLPLWAVGAVGLAMIVLHNAFDAVTPESLGHWGGLWKILHTGGTWEFAPGFHLNIIYPLVPWIGVMAMGYVLGAALTLEAANRRKWLVGLGTSFIAIFLLLRWSNLYGDPIPWSHQGNTLFTVFSFIKCHKYPPSLCFLLMTLGPALLLLAAFDRHIPFILRPLLVFGRTPLFYYLLHLPLIHSLAVIVNLVRFGRADWFYGPQPPAIPAPSDAGFGLCGVYFFSLVVILLLYPACKWFMGYKRRSPAAWLSYL